MTALKTTDEATRTKDEPESSPARGTGDPPVSPSSSSFILHPSSFSFSAYFSRTGWIHILLLLSVWLFLFPFFWMVATSIKTDEELTETKVLPEIAHFRPASPYVRPPVEPAKPS